MLKPNKHQLLRLKHALACRDKDISFLVILKGNWEFYLVLIFVMGWGAIWLQHLHGLAESGFLLGICFGTLWRDVTYARVMARFKPISDYVTDWDKVNEFLDTHTSADHGKP